MQIMVEGLALAAFGMLHQITTEPLLKKLLRYVMSDEARHVAFGVLSLQEFYAELTDAEMRERQEFAFDVARRLQRRFAHTEMWAQMGVDPDAVYRTMDRVNPPAQQMFQQLLFSKIVPNCKKLGLIDASGGWLRERFTEIGVIEFENLADTGEEYVDARRGRPGSRAAVAEPGADRRPGGTRVARAMVGGRSRMIVDREALGEAADRGLLAAFWAERQPDRVALYSEVGNRTFAEVDANANRLVRALRARGVQAGDGVALLCSNRPGVRRDRRRRPARRACGSPRSTGTSPPTRPATSSTTATRPRSSPTRASPTRRPARPSSRPTSARARRGRRRDRRLRRLGRRRSPSSRASAHRRSVGRAARCSTRRARPVVRRVCTGPSRSARRSRRRLAHAVRPRRARAPLHRPAVPRRAARVLVVGAGRARRADRADGRMVGGGDAAARSSSTASRTRTWCRRCSTGCSRCPTT